MAANKGAVEDDLSKLSAEEQAAINGDDDDGDTDVLDTLIGSDDDQDDDNDPDDDSDDDVDAKGANDNTKADDDEPPAQFQPQVVTQPVENFDGVMKDLTDKKADLRKQLNDGDIDLEEYEAKKDEVTDQVTELKLQQRDYENEVKRRTNEGQQRWQWEQEQFFNRDSNKIYGNSTLLNAALDTAVKELANNPANANQTGSWFLEEADRQVRSLMSGTAPAPKAPVEKGRKPDLSNIPKSLGNIPAAENTETGGEEFAYLEKLNGVELERELAKIARDPSKEARYLRS